jgi:hypothetical protein
VAVREGEVGELFHLIVAGSAAVSVRGEPRPPLAPGDCFGEIALLRGIPRTATVVADQALRTLALDRETFLVAVTGNSMSSAEADALVTRRLTADSPADPDRLWQVHDHAIVGCENADGCRRVLRHQDVDFGIGTPRVVVK